MKICAKTLGAGVFTLLLLALLTPAALALPPVPVLSPDGQGAYTATYADGGISAGQQFALLVVKDTALAGDALPVALAADDITYIDQTAATAGSVTFPDFIPRAIPDSSVFLAGGDLTEPLKIATIAARSADVTVRVQSYDPKVAVSLTLTGTGGEYPQTITGEASGSGQQTREVTFVNVPAGTYDLVVTKAKHLKYTLTGITVGEISLDLGTLPLLCGDINSDSYVNIQDLGSLVSPANYGKTTALANIAATDLNGDAFINIQDLGILVAPSNYGKGSVNIAYSAN
jgi:hypothetical protein